MSLVVVESAGLLADRIPEWPNFYVIRNFLHKIPEGSIILSCKKIFPRNLGESTIQKYVKLLLLLSPPWSGVWSLPWIDIAIIWLKEVFT